MKNIFLSIVALLIATISIEAQNLKFAHIDSQKLVAQLDEFKQAQQKMDTESNKIREQMQTMQTEFQTKYNDYVTKADSLPEVVRQVREQELQEMQQRIQVMQQAAGQSLQQMEAKLLQPIMDKIQTAIDEVGKEQGFIYIYNLSSQVILYHSEQSVDAEPLILAKLATMK
ncbi:MAG: OmpH family outer membrane protein [Marinilabiliaceae bacterium]|nr:OmpH family outer membrane protein [Marinilabiliaceae bacterium]